MKINLRAFWARITARAPWKLVVTPGQAVQIIGLPGSGKSLAAVKMAYDSMQYYDRVICTADIGLKLPNKNGNLYPAKKITAKELSTHRIKKHLVLFDEASLNGLDSRSWSQNFKGDEGLQFLAQFKLLRHYHNSYIVTNQGARETDSKLTDSIFKATWRACGKRFFGKLIKLEKLIVCHEFENGSYKAIYYRPPFLKGIFTGAYKYIPVKKYGRLYNSWATSELLDKLPEL